jgi:hypothetical protein
MHTLEYRRINTRGSSSNSVLDDVTLSKKSTRMIFTIINVYMPKNYLEKDECWGSLLGLANGNLPQNLIIVGDYNTTRGLKEK